MVKTMKEFLGKNREQDKIDIANNIEASGHHGYSNDYRRFPSRDEFDQAEFWLYFDEYFYFPQKRIYAPNLWMKGSAAHLINKGIDIYPIWNVDGFFMRVTADNFPGHKILIKLVETKRNEIKKHFKGDDLNISRIHDSPVEITVKYEERPFSVFKSMSIEEKNRCARKHKDIKEEFQTIFRNLIKDVDKKLIDDIIKTENRVVVEETD